MRRSAAASGTPSGLASLVLNAPPDIIEAKTDKGRRAMKVVHGSLKGLMDTVSQAINGRARLSTVGRLIARGQPRPVQSTTGTRRVRGVASIPRQHPSFGATPGSGRPSVW